MIVSPRVDRMDLRRLGFEQLAWDGLGVSEAPAVWNVAGVAPEQKGYLAYHRAEVLVS